MRDSEGAKIYIYIYTDTYVNRVSASRLPEAAREPTQRPASMAEEGPL